MMNGSVHGPTKLAGFGRNDSHSRCGSLCGYESGSGLPCRIDCLQQSQHSPPWHLAHHAHHLQRGNPGVTQSFVVFASVPAGTSVFSLAGSFMVSLNITGSSWDTATVDCRSSSTSSTDLTELRYHSEPHRRLFESCRVADPGGLVRPVTMRFSGEFRDPRHSPRETPVSAGPLWQEIPAPAKISGAIDCAAANPGC